MNTEKPAKKTYDGITIEDRWKTTGRESGARWYARVRDRRTKTYISKSFRDRLDPEHPERILEGSGWADAREWTRLTLARQEMREVGAGRWPLAEVVPSLLAQMKVDGFGKDYRRQIERAGEALKAFKVNDLADDDLGVKVRRYMESETSKRGRRRLDAKPSPTTVGHRFVLVRVMVTHAQKHMGMRTDPLASFVMPSYAKESSIARHTLQEVYTLAEVRQVLALDRWKDPIWLAWAIAIHTGLRAAELRALRWGDIDATTRMLRVTKGKGDKPRTVPLTWSPEFLEALEKRRRPSGAVCALDRSLHIKQLRLMLKEAGVTWDRGRGANGLPRRLTWHGCRRTCAAALLAAGTDSQEIRRGLGHEDIEMTGHYAASFTLWRAEVEREGWPAGKLRFLRCS